MFLSLEELIETLLENGSESTDKGESPRGDFDSPTGESIKE